MVCGTYPPTIGGFQYVSSRDATTEASVVVSIHGDEAGGWVKGLLLRPLLQVPRGTRRKPPQRSSVQCLEILLKRAYPNRSRDHSPDAYGPVRLSMCVQALRRDAAHDGGVCCRPPHREQLRWESAAAQAAAAAGPLNLTARGSQYTWQTSP